MKVRVQVRNQHVDISCGDGKQSFQWLAAVVQGRLKTMNVLRRSLETDQYIVTEVRNTNGELINPKDKIYEHAGPSGLVVQASISTAFPVDDWENPAMNDWMQAGYVHSQAGQHWVKEINVWRSNLAQLKSSEQHGDLNTSLLAQRVLPQTSRLIKIGFDFSEADVETAFNLDWKGMQWDWVPLGEAGKSAVGDLLKGSYSLVCNVFAHYAGTGKVGQRYGMTLEELGHLLHFLRCADWKDGEEQQVADIFAKTAPAAASSSSGSGGTSKLQERWPLMTRAHLATALVCVALEQSPESKAEAAVRDFLFGPLSAFWDSITSKYLCYACADPALKQALLEYFQLTKQVFHQRSTVDSKFGPRLSASGFQSLMEETGLVDSRGTDGEAACMAAFGLAQLNPSARNELPCMVYVEFVEALSRLALRVIENVNGLTDAKRVRMTLNMVAELPAVKETTQYSRNHK